MPVLNKGSFSLNLGIVQVTGELNEDDRQCAWELYTELSTRVAVTGKTNDENCKDFSGEIYLESLDSVYSFFQEARHIMRKFPVGKLGGKSKDHLGAMISEMIEKVLRPFLEKWQAKYRHWWDNESNPRIPPMKRQQEFPSKDFFLADWTAMRWLMRQVQFEIVKVYSLA